MKYHGKYSLKENLYNGKGMSLLNEGPKITDAFIKDMQDFVNSADRPDLNSNPRAVIGDAGEKLITHFLRGGQNMNHLSGNLFFPLVDITNMPLTPQNLQSGNLIFYAIKASSSLKNFNPRKPNEEGRGVNASTSSPVNMNAVHQFLREPMNDGIADYLDQAFGAEDNSTGFVKLGCYHIDLGTMPDPEVPGDFIVESVIIEKNIGKEWDIQKRSGVWQLVNVKDWPTRTTGSEANLEQVFGPKENVGEGGYQGTDIRTAGRGRATDHRPGFAINSSDDDRLAKKDRLANRIP